MAMHVKLLEELEAKLKAHVRPLEERIKALEAKLSGDSAQDTPAAPKTTRGRGKAATAEPAATEPQATVHDVVVAADAAAAGDAAKGK
jgi:hypothetical protein